MNASEWTDDNKFEDKIYEVKIENLVEKLKTEQQNDFAIKYARRQIEADGTVSKGCFKRVRSQLRIENNLHTKSGRPIIPLTLRNYVI